MKRCILLLLNLAVALTAYSAPAEKESSLSESNKIKIEKVLREALNEKRITQEQLSNEVMWLRSEPCLGVDRGLTASRKTELAKVIAKQESLHSVDVYQSFSFEGWYIIYVGTHVSDEPYLFYSGDPILQKGSIAAWSGAAMIFETSEIEQWVLENSPGIPKQLASCFAWHVTLNRD